MLTRLTIGQLTLACAVLLAACSKPPPPPTVNYFVENPIQLEAAMVRCAANRSESRYDPTCVNARQAVSLIEAREERARREALEAQSELKREALRRTQEAAAEARRRAAAAEARRREAAYLAQFGEPPPPAEPAGQEEATNMPGATIAEPIPAAPPSPAQDTTPPAADGGNAPRSETEPRDLDAIRDELRRRNEAGTGN